MISVEPQYWENRYIASETSGNGSIGNERDWKWNIIERYVPNVNNVLDVGCGDLSFWEGRTCEDYTGIDISKTIIKINKNNHPEWKFICENAENVVEGLTKDLVFCFDVLFHILNEKTYYKILYNLCNYSSDYILIHTWINNPFSRKVQLKKIIRAFTKLKGKKALLELKKIMKEEKATDGKYQYYRSLNDDLEIFSTNGFQLIGVERNPDGIGALFIFRKATNSFI